MKIQTQGGAEVQIESKNCQIQEKILFQKIAGSKKILGPTYLGSKKFCVQKILSQGNLG